MGTARVEIFRKDNKHTMYPGEISRNTPNPLEVISITSNETTETLSAAVSAQARFQDLYARVSVSEAGRVAVAPGGTGGVTAAGAGYLLTTTSQTIDLPVRAGDKIAVIDLA